MSENFPVLPEQIQIVVNNQYIKDFSFESPNSPQIFSTLDRLPDVNIGINVKTKTIAENSYEVLLSLKLEAKAGEHIAFITELVYGGIFLVPPTSEESLRFILLVEAPKLLFPFARSIISNVVRDGGFPQLLINPIDFVSLYNQQKEQISSAPAGTA